MAKDDTGKMAGADEVRQRSEAQQADRREKREAAKQGTGGKADELRQAAERRADEKPERLPGESEEAYHRRLQGTRDRSEAVRQEFETLERGHLEGPVGETFTRPSGIPLGHPDPEANATAERYEKAATLLGDPEKPPRERSGEVDAVAAMRATEQDRRAETTGTAVESHASRARRAEPSEAMPDVRGRPGAEADDLGRQGGQATR